GASPFALAAYGATGGGAAGDLHRNPADEGRDRGHGGQDRAQRCAGDRACDTGRMVHRRACQGVGPIVALTYATGIDDPARFIHSRDIGPHFGLTPRKYASGEIDRNGSITKAGDGAVREAFTFRSWPL